MRRLNAVPSPAAFVFAVAVGVVAVVVPLPVLPALVLVLLAPDAEVLLVEADTDDDDDGEAVPTPDDAPVATPAAELEASSGDDTDATFSHPAVMETVIGLAVTLKDSTSVPVNVCVGLSSLPIFTVVQLSGTVNAVTSQCMLKEKSLDHVA